MNHTHTTSNRSWRLAYINNSKEKINIVYLPNQARQSLAYKAQRPKGDNQKISRYSKADQTHNKMIKCPGALPLSCICPLNIFGIEDS